MKWQIKIFATDDSGSTAVEYALLVGIIGLGIISSVEGIPAALNAIFSSVVAAFG